MTEPDWHAFLRALDKPLAPKRDWLTWPDGWEAPLDFDLAASKARFTHLTTLLTDLFGGAVDTSRGPQDSALFGEVGIPAALTKTRPKPTERPLSITLYISNFGIATCQPYAHLHDDDQARVELASAEAGYPLVPGPVIDSPYDGPNSGVGTEDWTWFIRFFDYL